MPKVISSTDELLAFVGPKVFVTDFDGTMTGVDFFEVVLGHIPEGSIPDYWARCEAGEISHVEALDAIFRSAPHDLGLLESWLPEAKLDPRYLDGVAKLRATGWSVVVVSAGSCWYIEHLLDAVGDQLVIVANPGGFDPQRGLWMGWPDRSVPWYSAHFGIDKSQLVRTLVQANRTVAFAGDGRPDLAAAREVPEDQCFARSWLADQLRGAGRRYHSFDVWSQAAFALAARPSA